MYRHYVLVGSINTIDMRDVSALRACRQYWYHWYAGCISKIMSWLAVLIPLICGIYQHYELVGIIYKQWHAVCIGIMSWLAVLIPLTCEMYRHYELVGSINTTDMLDISALWAGRYYWYHWDAECIGITSWKAVLITLTCGIYQIYELAVSIDTTDMRKVSALWACM
jgi:hypothetical protein